ncbi:MAG TPA: Coenzyme F420 hydrogenase/dehydrogenase, beta subunit C-terminal domain [Abditibacteriaceae bacterium]|jgi:coenzyme F420-reducing hydrogenase beta subunit|nr:Coenzyme F420 hydrogenase/dehydrogenase, beta subunit C-terminal domain [Abditibacteriaceae bacterium]
MASQPLPLLSPHDVVRSGLCIGCGSCVAQSDQPDVSIDFNCYGHFEPFAPSSWMHQKSASFSRTCPFSPTALNEDELSAELFPDIEYSNTHTGRFQAAYVGHVEEEAFRDRGSSGGMVSWVLEELLRRGLVDGVAHVASVDDPQNDGRFFRYRIARTVEEVRGGAKSRYYPVEMSGILEEIRQTPGRYAVVGVPCFIKALQLLRREDTVVRERVAFTLGLFCGHMKSARLMESFAWQMDVDVEDIQRVEFRIKDPSRPASTYTAQMTLRDGTEVRKDWWNLVDGDWGAGFFQNSACNFCDDVVGETADISFGDAWVEPYSSDGRGTNVVILRNRVLDSVVKEAIEAQRLKLEDVDAEFVHQTQAAGFRQRREGLSFRLYWRLAGRERLLVQPRKRVARRLHTIPKRRQLIYRMRAFITAWSHRVFWLARRMKRRELYTRWAKTSVELYHGLAYGRGKIGEWVERMGLRS